MNELLIATQIPLWSIQIFHQWFCIKNYFYNYL